MSIKNIEDYMDSFWDWDIFEGAFGDSKISPTDIDGCLERKGQTLVLETKHAGVRLPMGQAIMFNTWRMTGLFTIILVWGNPGRPVKAKILTKEYVSDEFPCDLALLYKITQDWFNQADERKSVDLTKYPEVEWVK